MARLNSFYCPPEQWREPLTLEDGEAHHMLKVLRTTPGTLVRIFDGKGREGLFRVMKADRQRAVLEPESITEHERPRPRLALVLGWNKSARRDWLLEKAVELEAAGVWFWQASRSQGRVPDRPKETWQSKLVAAAKQCANPWLPELATLDSLDALVSAASTFSSRYLLWEEPGCAVLDPDTDLSGEGDMLMVLGPEGGLEEAEAEALMQAGFNPRSLGRRILRWETAALLGLGLAFWTRQRLPAREAQP